MRTSEGRGGAPELIHTFLEPLRDASGKAYEVRVFALQRGDGTWIGWLEFTDPTGRILRTDRETTQSSAEQVRYWARGLGTTYLDGALDRAERN